AHAGAVAIGGLVNVAPEHATDLRVAVDDLEERRRVAQADAVEPRAAHRQGLMMHAEEDVPAGAPRERVLERAEAQRTQAARVLAREVSVEQHDRPVARMVLSADLEPRPAEDLRHPTQVVVVAWDAEHGNAERR